MKIPSLAANSLIFGGKYNRINVLRELSYVHGMIKSPVYPKVFEIETTTSCPSRCLSCPKKYIFKRKDSVMPIALFGEIIEQVRPEYQIDSPGGVPNIHLTHYGDISLYPYFPEAVGICKKRGLFVSVSTNASLFSGELAQRVLEKHLDEIWMVLDGMDDETSMRIRGVSAKNGIANIHALIQLKQQAGLDYPKISVIMIRQPGNKHQWAGFMDYWNKVEGVHPHLGCYSNFGGNVPEINDILRELREMKAQSEEDARIRFVSSFKCYYPWHSVSIQSDGLVLPCCRDMNGIMPLGDLTKQSLEDIWNGYPIKELRRELNSGIIKNPLCLPCREANNEIGIPNRFYPGFNLIHRIFPKYRFSGSILG